MKYCKTCHIEKSLDNFGKDMSQKDGKAYRCRECCSIEQLKYRKNRKPTIQRVKRVIDETICSKCGGIKNIKSSYCNPCFNLYHKSKVLSKINNKVDDNLIGRIRNFIYRIERNNLDITYMDINTIITLATELEIITNDAWSAGRQIKEMYDKIKEHYERNK